MNSWVSQQLASKNSKCFFNNLAVNICSNATCVFQNPFICRCQDCQCVKNHHQCSSHSLDFVLQKIITQNNPSQDIKKSVEEIFKNFIEEINKQKNYLIENIKSGQALKFLQKSIDDQKNKLQTLICQSPTGSVISKIIALKDSSLAQKQSALKMRAVKHSFLILQMKRLNPYFNHMEKLLFSQFQRFNPDQQLSSLIVPPIYNPYIRSQQSQEFVIKMLSPSIIYTNNDIVRCEIKLKTQSDILFGIGLKQKLRKEQFNIDEDSQKHGYFIRSNLNKIYYLGRDGQPKVADRGIKFNAGETICAEINLKTRKLKFTSRQKMQRKTVNIIFWPEIDEDQYNFCIGYKYSNDRVDLVNNQQLIPIINQKIIEKHRKM